VKSQPDGYPRKSLLFRWANEDRIESMPTPEEMEAQGYERSIRHPRWPKSWLMVKGDMQK
jgi:hypothetical protein